MQKPASHTSHSRSETRETRLPDCCLYSHLIFQGDTDIDPDLGVGRSEPGAGHPQTWNHGPNVASEVLR